MQIFLPWAVQQMRDAKADLEEVLSRMHISYAETDGKSGVWSTVGRSPRFEKR